MMKWLKKCRAGILLAAVLMLALGMQAYATEDDNSLSSLGIQTEGAVVSPEFSYDTWSYTVTVPAGTTELSLDPLPSSSSATISSITGTTLNEDGTGYVLITVQAGDGSQFSYELNVASDGTAVAAETETEKQTETEKVTEAETEPQTEDSRYVKVDKNSLQEAENTITDLKGQITTYKDKVSLFTKIMYGLIALAVILLFIVINLLLKKKDMKAELNDYRSYGYSNSKKAQKQEEKLQKKEQKSQKKQKNPNSQTMAYPDDAEFMSYPAGNTSGLEVKPQTSQKKAKQMPQYEQPPVSQPVNHQAPHGYQPQQPAGGHPQAAPQQPAAGGNKKNDVEVTMIDL